MSDTEKSQADSTTPGTEDEPKKEESQSSEATVGKSVENGSDLSAQLEEKIIRQVEYYFGDRNLPRDKFLQSAAAENEGGWVPIATLLTFNRLKALSSNPDLIVKALRKSSANVLEVNSEGTSVRRSPDNPPPDIFSPEQRQKMKEKTVYVKGFAEDAQLDDIQSFFDQYGKLEHVQMRRNLTDRTFKGSVFVEFKQKDKATSFLSLPTVTFKGNELVKESKETYYARKAEERKKAKEEAKQASAKTDQPEVSSVRTKGAILFFKGSDLDTTREDIKEVTREFATVAYIDFQKGDKEGYVRFEEENGATKAMDGLKAAATEDGNPQLCGADVELRVLEGAEEEEYWTKALDFRSKNKNKGRAKKHGGRLSNLRDRKRKYGSDKGAPVPKQSKQDDEGDGEAKEEAGNSEVTAST